MVLEGVPVMDHYGLIDWDRDGDYVDTGEDVTADILTPPGFTTGWGRDQPRSFSPPVAPEARTTLNNEAGTYSNLYTGSPLYGYVERGAPSLFDVQYGTDVDFNDPSVGFNSYETLFSGVARRRLFTGSVWDVEESGSMGSYVASLRMISTLGLLLTDKTVTTQQLYTSIRTSEVITIMLDDIGWPSDKRRISVGQTVMLYWWAEEKSAMTIVIEMLLTEGASAIAYIDSDGYFVFHGRDWRDSNPRSMTSQATFSDTILGTDPSFSDTAISFNDAFTLFNGLPSISMYYVEEPVIRAHPDDVINSATALVNTRILDAVEVVWSYGGSISLGSFEAIDFWPSTTDPFQAAVLPVAGVDYTATQPITPTLQALTGQQAKLTLTAGAAGSVITGLQLRAQLLKIVGDTKIKETLSPAVLAESINRHGDKHFPYQIWPEIAPNTAQDLVNALVLRYMRLRPQFTIAVVATDVHHQNAIFRLDVDDRITIVNQRRSISTDVWIERVDHRVLSKGVHMAVFGCEQVYQSVVARWGVIGDTQPNRKYDNTSARWGF